MLRVKPDVRIVEFTTPLAQAFAAATSWSLRTRIDVEVNSVDDDAAGRGASTLHGASLAVDLDTAGDRPADTHALAEHLRRALPPGFDVVLEGDHVHVEYDLHRPPLRPVG